MKKHDEGYILAYVFVILVVICLIATSVLTIPLTNLRIQKAAVAQMQDQYDAAGAVEEALTIIRQKVSSNTNYYTNASAAKEPALNKIREAAAIITDPDKGLEGVSVTLPDWLGSAESDYIFQMTVIRGNAMITCEVVLQDLIVYDLAKGNYKVQVPLIAYNAYTVTEAVGGGN